MLIGATANEFVSLAKKQIAAVREHFKSLSAKQHSKIAISKK